MARTSVAGPGAMLRALARRKLHRARREVSSLRALGRCGRHSIAIHYDLAYLSRVLNGKQRPSLKLAKALDCSPCDNKVPDSH